MVLKRWCDVCEGLWKMLTLTPNVPPLRENSNGGVYVVGTRVTFDSVIASFQEGATPEDIAQQYPVLDLTNVYAVVTYYLQNRNDVEAYLQARRREALESHRHSSASRSTAYWCSQC